MNLTGVVAFCVGAVLMYSAVKDKDPRDVVLTSLGQKPRYGKSGTGSGDGSSSGDGGWLNEMPVGIGGAGSGVRTLPAPGDRNRN